MIDRVLTVPNADALRCSLELAQKEGIFVGITSGATLAGPSGCREAHKGATVLAMLPDTGERYMSTPLFGDILADMTPQRSSNLAVDPWLPT